MCSSQQKNVIYAKEQESMAHKKGEEGSNQKLSLAGGINWEIGTDIYTLLYIK